MEKLKLWLIAAIGIGLVFGAVADISSYLGREPYAGPAARVLIVDNSLNRPIYMPQRQWRPHLGDVPSDVVHIPGGDPIPPLDTYTHVIISGSTASLVEPPDWVEREVSLVRQAVDAGLAVLGSCFGHQMLVFALSGSEFVARAATPEVGWIAVEMTAEDPLFVDLPNPWHAFAWHYDEVVSPPAPWRALGSSAAASVHVVRYGDAPVWGLQAHPETKPCTAKLLLFLDKLFFDWDSEEITTALRQRPRDDRIIGTLIERFLQAGPTD